jgi:hypothetical protein
LLVRRQGLGRRRVWGYGQVRPSPFTDGLHHFRSEINALPSLGGVRVLLRFPVSNPAKAGRLRTCFPQRGLGRRLGGISDEVGGLPGGRSSLFFGSGSMSLTTRARPTQVGRAFRGRDGVSRSGNPVHGASPSTPC